MSTAVKQQRERPKLTLEKVVELKAAGWSETQIAREYGCAQSYVWRLQNRYRLNPEGKGLPYDCRACGKTFISYARTRKPHRCGLCQSWDWEERKDDGKNRIEAGSEADVAAGSVVRRRSRTAVGKPGGKGDAHGRRAS